MPSIAVDAGPLIALFDQSERDHARVIECMARQSGAIVTNFVVVGEVAHMLGFDPRAQRDFLKWAGENLELDYKTADDLDRIVTIMQKYEDLPADFADASLVALCERLGIDTIASFDADFDVYRLHGRRPMKNLLR